MRQSTTSVVTDRRRPAHARSRINLAALLIAELISALFLVGRTDAPVSPTLATPASLRAPTAAATTETLSDGRTARLIGLGGQQTEQLLARIATEMDDAAHAVTAFWGPDWPREIVVAAAGTDAQFASLAGGASDTAATTTAERIMFAPGAAAMNDSDLRIVLRHELFHYAARARTAADAPQWLTEGVADFVGRSPTPVPPNISGPAVLPTDADLNTVGPERSSAYDRAWWFSRFVADRYGTTTLRDLYLRVGGHGHPDPATALQDTLGDDMDPILVHWRQWLAG